MKILFIHSLMFHRRTWRRVKEILAREGIELHMADQTSAVDFLEEKHGTGISILIAELALGMPGADQVLEKGFTVSNRLGLSPEIPADFTTVSLDDAAEFKKYLKAVSEDNYVNAMRFLAAKAGMDIRYNPPVKVLTTGIYHPDAPLTFDRMEEYNVWLSGRLKDPGAPRVGLLFYYSQLVEDNTEDVDAVVLALQSHGLFPVLRCFAKERKIRQPPDRTALPGCPFSANRRELRWWSVFWAAAC